MITSITDPETRRFVEGYIDSHIDYIAEKTYAALMLVDTGVNFELIRARVRREFDHIYDMVFRVEKMFGKDPCEAELARNILNSLEDHAILEYSKGLDMRAH